MSLGRFSISFRFMNFFRLFSMTRSLVEVDYALVLVGSLKLGSVLVRMETYEDACV